MLTAFYGDSYTLGVGASDPAHRWSTLICASRGWREFNPSVDGLGFVRNRGALDLPTALVAAAPDILIVALGLNDNFAYPTAGESIRSAMRADLRRLRTELPAARMVVVEPFWYTDERPESVETIIGWARAAAAEVGADFVPGASRWIEGRSDLMAADGLHPDDAGYAEIGRRMDSALTTLGLSTEPPARAPSDARQ